MIPRHAVRAETFLRRKGWRRDGDAWISPTTGTRYSMAAALSLYGATHADDRS